MSANEEIEEHIQHARDTFDKTVAGCMAVIAAALAIVSIIGQHFNTEKLLSQQKASDMWAYYNAKDIRRYNALIAQDLLTATKAAPDAIARYKDTVARYNKQTAEEQQQARDFEKERDRFGEEAEYFHFGEGLLEVSIVLSSLSILLKRKPFFAGGVVVALIGIGVSVCGWVRFTV